MARRQISSARRFVYYTGLLVSIVGMLVFFSIFVTGILRIGDFAAVRSHVFGEGFRALTGMAMVGVGAALSLVGRMGLAGSGLVDEEQCCGEEQELLEDN